MLRNALIAGRSRWAVLAVVVTSVIALFVTATGAQAVVLNDQGTVAGVALAPSQSLSGTPISTVTSNAPCTDPWLSSDFTLPNSGLCWHAGGKVIHANETFALTWDAPTPNNQHAYWAGTRGYVEQFLRDVATGSGTFTSPYALTAQYQDGSGRAGNSSIFGGGCIDYGSVGGSACEFGDPNGAGHDYGTNGCPVSGTSFVSTPNTVCLTDGQIQTELAAMVSETGILGHTEPGYTPLVVLLTPPGVVTCLDASGTLCSANSHSTVQFCSYHSHVNVGGTDVAYVVQPWVAATSCDDPSDPPLIPNPTPQQLSTEAGLRLVNPLSQGELAALVNPDLDGWFALDGSEINDNGCVGEPDGDDKAIVGDSSQNPYFLQHEFNNAGVISSDPYTYFGCAPNVILSANFVVPSAVNEGDVVAFDGSSSASTLLIPNAGYQWNFGDGQTATGPSVEHSYAKGGVYTVTLTVTDRGGDQSSLSQNITVLGPSGQPPSNQPGQQGGSAGGTAAPLRVHIQLLPQGFRQVLRSGIAVRVTSNGKASGFASIKVSRAIAKYLHLRVGRAPAVAIARGFVSEIFDGSATLHLDLSRATVAKLKRLRHMTLTVTLQLVGSAGDRLTIDAAGRY
jgi:hypothetical protein